MQNKNDGFVLVNDFMNQLAFECPSSHFHSFFHSAYGCDVLQFTYAISYAGFSQYGALAIVAVHDGQSHEMTEYTSALQL